MTIYHSVVQADLVFAVILLPQAPKYWTRKHETPSLPSWWICYHKCPARIQGCIFMCFVLFLVLVLVLGIEPRTSFVLTLDAGGCWFEDTNHKYQPKMYKITLVAHVPMFRAHCSSPCGLCMLMPLPDEEPSTFQGLHQPIPGYLCLVPKELAGICFLFCDQNLP